MPKKVFLVLLLFNLINSAEVLTLPEAIDCALEHSPQFQIVKREREIDRSKAFQGYGAVLPNLELKYSDLSRKTPQAEFSIPGTTSNESLNNELFPNEIKTRTTELSASQLLFSFSGFAAWVAAGAAEKLAEFSYQDKREAFILNLKRSFYDLQIAKSASEVGNKIYNQAKGHARETEIMYQASTIAKKDYLDARVAELSAKQNAETLRKNYRLALYSFNNLLGKEINLEITPATYDVKIIPAEKIAELNEENLLTAARDNKPAYKAFEETVRLAEADDLNSWGESLPSVYYIYSKQHNDADKESAFSPDGDTEVKGISAGWKFFSGGANFHKINEKKNNKEKMQELAKNTKNYLTIEIKNSLTELKISGDNLGSAKEALALATESLRLAELSFQGGLITQTQYNDSLTQYENANTNYLKALYDYEYAKDKLNYSAGKEVL